MPLLNTRFGIDLSTLIQVTDVFFQEERAICQELNDTMGIGIAHRKIGEALNELGNYESATKHHQKYLGNNNAVLKSYLAVKMNLILQSWRKAQKIYWKFSVLWQPSGGHIFATQKL